MHRYCAYYYYSFIGSMLSAMDWTSRSSAQSSSFVAVISTPGGESAASTARANPAEPRLPSWSGKETLRDTPSRPAVVGATDDKPPAEIKTG